MIAKLLMAMAVWGPAALGQQQPTAPSPTDPLGTRYSASTDVSHISFNSPLVTYGAALNEIRLPATPIQPANLKQLPQNLEGAKPDTGVQDQLQRLQVTTNANQQQQYISVQQFPANPQLQNNDQHLPLAQAQQQYLSQQQQQHAVAQPQQQYLSQQQQYAPAQQYLQQQPQYAPAQQYLQQQQQYDPAQQYLQQQQQYAPVQQYLQQQLQYPPVQQYPALQSQQPYVTQQPQAEYLQRLQSSGTGGYFATGPYAAHYQQPGSVLVRQPAPQPLLPQAPSAAQLTSRVAFNGPTAGFSYSF
ncbi:nuclear transcription factor Y subunit beta-like [Euwallacea fornicatus]|uniref:nuclear transcription factor Y subunit beta-like n=1 Tax=Euwallacea fornicatus TaxID=995702 RepID=UPI0033906C74